ncbi:MAG: hypothetical protein PHH59_16835 [Methylovulum sp.]|uniref:hypothetical protein n=1 Tax=Methylovulum sp. TaxID=1916980 RepID=UPI00262E2F75|nr:hypothetical protein [Methylovulum sp.]MDD2725663.1 hypothetical protein [Methylovulum sp.]MDD5126258.1 hypothetical protein [Methylovulum sp.]
MLLKKISFTLSAIALLSGCASIVTDSAHPVAISSLPSNAEFAVVNQQGKTVHSGKTPATVTLKSDAGYFKGEKYTLKFQKEGYGTQSTPLNAHLNGWYWGNLLFLPVIGHLIVDPLTGAMWALPESKPVVLVPKE